MIEAVGFGVFVVALLVATALPTWLYVWKERDR